MMNLHVCVDIAVGCALRTQVQLPLCCTPDACTTTVTVTRLQLLQGDLVHYQTYDEAIIA